MTFALKWAKYRRYYMQIDTEIFGRTAIEDSDIYTFSDGILGFEENKKYALIKKPGSGFDLMWLQAIENTLPCFTVFHPHDIINGYSPVVEAGDLKALNVSGAEELEFLLLAVIPSDIRYTTVNLKSPIAINKNDRTAKQVILLNNDYPIKFYLGEPEDNSYAEAR